jgi:hypothetical protein
MLHCQLMMNNQAKRCDILAVTTSLGWMVLTKDQHCMVGTCRMLNQFRHRYIALPPWDTWCSCKVRNSFACLSPQNGTMLAQRTRDCHSHGTGCTSAAVDHLAGHSRHQLHGRLHNRYAYASSYLANCPSGGRVGQVPPDHVGVPALTYIACSTDSDLRAWCPRSCRLMREPVGIASFADPVANMDKTHMPSEQGRF